MLINVLFRPRQKLGSLGRGLAILVIHILMISCNLTFMWLINTVLTQLIWILFPSKLAYWLYSSNKLSRLTFDQINVQTLQNILWWISVKNCWLIHSPSHLTSNSTIPIEIHLYVCVCMLHIVYNTKHIHLWCITYFRRYKKEKERKNELNFVSKELKLCWIEKFNTLNVFISINFQMMFNFDIILNLLIKPECFDWSTAILRKVSNNESMRSGRQAFHSAHTHQYESARFSV